MFNQHSLYLSFTSPNEVWPKKIFERRTDVNFEGLGYAVCTLNEPVCNFFLYQYNECLLGAFSKTDGDIVLPSPGETVIYFRRGN